MATVKNRTGTVLGVTGPICSGKNAVCDVLEREGYLIIDVDLFGHQALSVKKEEISRVFGTGVLDPCGEIDRKILGNIVFSDEDMLSGLESIVHPWMSNRTREILSSYPDRNVVINAAIIFKMGLHVHCDRIIWVSAPFLSRLHRLMQRSNLGVFEAFSRIRSQNGLRTQYSFVRSDIYDIRNTGSLERLEDRVRRFLEEMRK